MNMNSVCVDERRLFEYFIVAGLTDGAEELQPLNNENGNGLSQFGPVKTDAAVICPGLAERSMAGSDVFVSFKKHQSCFKRISYKPEVLDCFPKIKETDKSLVLNVPIFCLPMGVSIESWPESQRDEEKLFSTCVLTDEKGTKFYGASLSFYENYTKPLTESQLKVLEIIDKSVDESNGNMKHEGASYRCNKSICVVSRYPFFESFRKFLFFVQKASVNGPQKIPIERYISHMIYEVPFPSSSRPRVLVQLKSEALVFDNHDDSQIPLSGAMFVVSLKNLGSENFILAMLLALLEQKILFHSVRPSLLTSVSETLCALMFPFCWQCPYIPQCPLGFAGVLHAPLPFIAGVDSMYFYSNDKLPSDVTSFDLDTRIVAHSINRKSLKISLLPQKPLKKLKSTLDSMAKKLTDSCEPLIREAFLRFMCSLMAGYTDHLRPILKAPREVSATDTTALFNVESFISSRDKRAFDFYSRFSKTQCFNRFIEERSFVSDKNTQNMFFDDCISKILQEKALKIEFRLYDTSSSNRAFVVPSPKILSCNGSDVSFNYERFPEVFNPDLFETELILRLKAEGHSISLSSELPSDQDLLKNWAIRTAQELKISTVEAANFVEESPLRWPKTLLFYAYSLWFLQLSSLLSMSRNKEKMLKLAFRVLGRMERSNLPFHDQVCYRILMYQCGEYNRPELATRVLHKMKKMGIQLNAVTYGIYHRALMQGEWPSDARLRAVDAWSRVRMLVEVCAVFRLHSSNDNSENSRLLLSPTLSSLVHQIRRQAVKGYEEALLKGNILLKRCGINGLSNQSSSLNRSYSVKDTSMVSTISSSEDHSVSFSGSQLDYSDPAFQLVSGVTGDMLSAQFWMREISPHNIADLKNFWIMNEEGAFIDVVLCSCSACPSCKCVIYDEELMAGCSVVESDFSTLCPYCSHSFVPSLKVSMKGRRQQVTASWYMPLSINIPEGETCAEAMHRQNMVDDEFSVPFVSPLILRQELESLLVLNSFALSEVSLRSTSPAIFWNLLYYYRRLDLPTHILTWVSPQVHIRCVYDIPSMHPGDESPIYFANHRHEIGSALPSNSVSTVNIRLWQHVVESLKTSNLFLILKHLINEHRQEKDGVVGLRNHFSMYRDVLFVALDRFNRSVDREQFDRQYCQELENLPPRILSLLSIQDYPPKALVTACRKVFLPLDVL